MEGRARPPPGQARWKEATGRGKTGPGNGLSHGALTVAPAPFPPSETAESVSHMKTYPWHSTRPGETVHHDNTSCTEGNNIETYYLQSGTGGRPLCKHCARLDATGR